jgi:excisionase family DNA binding protein
MAHDNLIEIANKKFATALMLARILNVHKRTVLNWSSEHGLPVISIGHMRLFDLDEVSGWLDKHKK